MTDAAPLALDDALLIALLRSVLGSSTLLVSYRVVLRRDDYAVIAATLASPAREVVVKLAGPRAPIACPFDRTAAIVDLVRRQTPVPTFEVLASDVSYRDWPWRYLVTTHLPGVAWPTVSAPFMGSAHQTYHDLGQAVAHLHHITFPAFGEIDADGSVHRGMSLLEALEDRAKHRVADPRHVALFASVLQDRASLFDDVTQPALCHEDLNPTNILLQQEDGFWRLSAILDFDSAWAGDPESDLARLDLWRGMMGDGFRTAYETIRPIAPRYAERRPVYQLLWCLEYASASPQHLADTAAVCAKLTIPPITFS